jgi:hypothetical protein
MNTHDINEVHWGIFLLIQLSDDKQNLFHGLQPKRVNQ